MKFLGQNIDRLVIKIGSSLLVDKSDGDLNRGWMADLAADLARLPVEVIIVSSGSVAAGRVTMGLLGQQLNLAEKQATAAVGQIELINAWRTAFELRDRQIAQVLLTVDDTERRKRHLNAKETLETLVEKQVIPIVNENDSVATQQLRIGDNDRLAARVAQMLGADMLLLLTDIDGLYTGNPSNDPTAKHLPVVANIDQDIMDMAGGADSAGLGTGGMITKLEAGRIATAAGCAMVIADGQGDHPLRGLQTGAQHTLFKPVDTPASARKQWISGMVQHHGTIMVDDGAKKALLDGSSLLPVGVVKVDGDFDRGDPVLITDLQEHPLAQGLVRYKSAACQALVGQQTSEITRLLGYNAGDCLVHRSDLVLV